jgi:hypothetical protein
VLKYADDMAIVGLLKHGNSDSFYFEYIKCFEDWCKVNNLFINTDKTKEMVFNFSRRHSITSSVFMNGFTIEKVSNFKYLGTIFSEDLKWHKNTEFILNKLKTRFYAFFKFMSFKPSKTQELHFIKTIILPVLLYNAEIWFFSSTEAEKQKLLRLFRRWNGHSILISDIITSRILSFAHSISVDNTHFLNSCFVSNCRIFRSLKCKTDWFLNSFIPTSIRLLNESTVR